MMKKRNQSTKNQQKINKKKAVKGEGREEIQRQVGLSLGEARFLFTPVIGAGVFCVKPLL
jgi:hypothetical protein